MLDLWWQTFTVRCLMAAFSSTHPPETLHKGSFVTFTSVHQWPTSLNMPVVSLLQARHLFSTTFLRKFMNAESSIWEANWTWKSYLRILKNTQTNSLHVIELFYLSLLLVDNSFVLLYIGNKHTIYI
ncbi:hypothetical protein COOONC_22757 [Cooperia oncophora]